MFTRGILSALLVSILVQSGLAQVAEKEKPKVVTDELRKEAVVFLRETNAEVGNLRTLENRIGFSSEMAGLMWFHDQKEASAMYQTVITDFKQLLADYDAQMNALGLTPDESQYRSGIFGGAQTDKTRLTQKFFKAMGVRQQIAMSLVEHEPTLAFNFYNDTLSLISNAELRKSFEQRDSYFEMQLIRRIAATHPEKAVEFGRKSIAKGVGWGHVELLQQIYDKDNAKGAEFADAIVSRYKSDKGSSDNLYNLGSLLRMGGDNAEKIKKEGGKKPMFTEQNLRDLAEVLAQGMMQMKEGQTDSLPFVTQNIELIEKYAPGRALQIRAKFPSKVKPKSAAVISGSVEEPQVMKTVVPDAENNAENRARKEQEETMKSVMGLGAKELSKEERDKIVAQARKIIDGIGNKQEKIMALTLLASQVTTAGDKQLAAEVMKDAQALVNPQPKNYQDFMEIWFLASAYSMTDAEKAFPLLDDSIMRLNDTLAAFIKVGEFMDVSGEMIDDGEVQLGAFGGSMMSGLTRELGVADDMIRNLAIADFGKTKALTNKIDRAEVRILAKMLVLRAVLNDGTKKTAAEKVSSDEF